MSASLAIYLRLCQNLSLGTAGYCVVPFGNRALPTSKLIPQSQHVVNEVAGYCTVATSTLNRKRLLLSGEVDCMDNTGCPTDEPPPLGKRVYIELKTQALIKNARQHERFEKYKLLKFWAQSYLLNVPNVIIGFRDEDGYVQKIQTMNTNKIPGYVEGKSDRWDRKICINFLDQILDFMKAIVDQEPEGTLFSLKYRNEKGSKNVVMQPDKTVANFLPDWFTHSL